MSKIIHYAFDAVLITTLLAGIKKSTGLRPATSKIENKTLRDYVEKYLDLGEWMFNMTTVYVSQSRYFIKSDNSKNTSHPPIQVKNNFSSCQFDKTYTNQLLFKKLSISYLT